MEPDDRYMQIVAELRVRYDALRISTTEECMTMLLAAAAQMAHRNETHPASVLYAAAEQTEVLWGERWGMFIHDMLEAEE